MGDYVEQPDGRMVAGPELADSASSRTSKRSGAVAFFAVAVLAAFGAGLLVGGLQSDDTPLGDAIFASVKDGCIPVPLTPAVGETEADVNTALVGLIEQIGDRRYERFVSEMPGGPVGKAYPDSKFIGLLIAFNCLEGGGA